MSFNARSMFFTVLFLSAALGWAQESGGASKKDEGRLVNYVEFKLLNVSLGEPEPHIRGLFVSAFDDLLSESQIVGLTISEPDLGARLTEGFHFNKYFALEGSLTYLGEVDIRAVNNEGETYDISALYYGGDVQAVGMYPITDSISAFAKIGLSYWQADVNTVGFTRYEGEGQDRVLASFTQDGNVPGGDDNGFEEVLGVGFRMEINDSFTWSFSWDRTEIDGFDTDTAALGLGFKY